MLLDGLYTALTGDSGMKTLLGTTRSDGSTGIFPVVAVKEPTMPFVVYEQVGNTNDNMTAEGLNRTQSARFRYHCYAADYKGAYKLAQAIKKVLAAFTGTLTDTDATPVQNIDVSFEGDGPVDTETRNTIYNRIIDFEVIYVDTTN